jgi:hypothetical protein
VDEGEDPVVEAVEAVVITVAVVEDVADPHLLLHLHPAHSLPRKV